MITINRNNYYVHENLWPTLQHGVSGGSIAAWLLTS